MTTVFSPLNASLEMRLPMKSTTNRLAALGLGAALSLGLVAPAFAQSSATTTATQTAAASTTKPTRAQRDAEHTARKAAFAARLGVTVAAFDQAAKDQAKVDVDKALAAGTINAAQATAYKTLIDNDTSGRNHMRFPHAPMTDGATEPTQAERDAQRTARLTEFVARLGVTLEKYTQASKDQAKADVDAAVTAGRITVEEATARKAAIDAGTGLEGRGDFDGGFGKGRHGHSKHGGRGGRHGGRN
jgi:hypothetical protein